MLGSSGGRVGRCTLGIEALKVAKRGETTKSLACVQPFAFLPKLWNMESNRSSSCTQATDSSAVSLFVYFLFYYH